MSDSLLARTARGQVEQEPSPLTPSAIRKSLDPCERGACTWTQDEDDGFWYTECGNAYEFMEDGPAENNHRFCPYCGGRLNVREYEDTWEDDE